MPRFFADESCDFAIVRALRTMGFDVRVAAEDMSGSTDKAILEAAVREGRILLTEDKDFGEWVFAHKSVTAGVVFMRYPSNMRSLMISLTVELVNLHGKELFGKFTVLEPGRARIRSIARE